MAAVMLASPQSAQAFDAPSRYRATVSLYGGCLIETRSGKYQLLYPDVDKPLLMLMASEDQELRPADCQPALDQMKTAGKPVTWHVYPDTHHAWDQADQRGLERIPTVHCEPNVYKYSADATKDSTARVIAFLNAQR